MPPRDTSDATPPPAQQHHETAQALHNDSYPAAPKAGDASTSAKGDTTTAGKVTDASTTSGDGPNKAGQALESGKTAAQDAKLGLPSLELYDSKAGGDSGAGSGSGRQGMMENAQKTLADPKASAADKLSTVEKLAEGGVKNISVPDADGKMRDYKIDVEHAGNRSMVHLYGKDDKGRDQVVLRGVDNGNGNFVKEQDRSGRSVDYTGANWAKGDHGTSTVGTVGSDTAARPPAERPTVGTDTTPPAQRPPVSTDTTPPAQQAKPTDTTPPVEQPKTPDATDAKPGSIDRSQFNKQLEDPRVMAAFAGRMNSEVGSQGKQAQVAFAEEVMNRAASRNQTLMQALSGSYYPTSHPGHSNNPEFKDSITKAWKEGTDTIHGATGNASGRVGFGVAGGHYDANKQWVSPNQTARFGGERFGMEQVDLNKGWAKKYESLKRGGASMS